MDRCQIPQKKIMDTEYNTSLLQKNIKYDSPPNSIYEIYSKLLFININGFYT